MKAKTNSKINPKGSEIFRNKYAIKYFEKFRGNNHIYELGIDNNGYVYIAWLNGAIDRYSRREFINIAERFYLDND